MQLFPNVKWRVNTLSTCSLKGPSLNNDDQILFWLNKAIHLSEMLSEYSSSANELSLTVASRKLSGAYPPFNCICAHLNHISRNRRKSFPSSEVNGWKKTETTVSPSDSLNRSKDAISWSESESRNDFIVCERQVKQSANSPVAKTWMSLPIYTYWKA